MINKTIKCQIGWHSSQGGRPNHENEDSLGLWLPGTPSSEALAALDGGNVFSLGKDGVVMVVADGMGGLNAGEVASRIAVDAVKQSFEKKAAEIDSISRNCDQRRIFLEGIIREADRAIRDHSTKHDECANMGSTLVIAWLVRQMLTVSWCGDSRAYILHGGQLEMLTHDHSYVQELVDKGELDYEASFSHPDNNIVTHCLGANDESSVKADSRTTDVENGDIILLCSDGISGVLFDDARFYKGKPLSAENLQDTLVRNCADAKDAAAELIAAAERCGWHDNATAIVCRIADGSHPPRTAFRWLRRHWWVLIVAIALGIVVKHLPPATQTEQPEGTDTIENAPAETTAETSEPVVKTDTVYEPAKKPAKKSNTAADTCPVATGKGFKGNVNIGLLAAGGCMPLTNGKDTSANETESTDNNEVPGESAEKTDSN